MTVPMTEQWRISLLGGFRAEQRGRTITRFKSQKIASLLAYLAYHLRQTHSRDFLIELIWPESGSMEAGRNSLSVALSSLRNQFEPPGTPSNSVIRADRFSVSLNPLAVTTDVAEFEAEVRASLRTGDSAEDTNGHDRLAAALELYRGRLLPTLYDEWIAGEQQRLSGLFADAAMRLVDRLEQTGDLSSALGIARRAVAVDPFVEDIHGRVIRLLSETSQPAAALQQFNEWTRIAKDELGEEPSAHLVALVRQIEQQSPAKALRTGSAGVRTERVPAGAAAFAHDPTATTIATLTVLFTDIEGSTKTWERAGEPYAEALRVHHSLLRQVFSRHSGQELKEAGDSFLVAFTSAAQALQCATEAQRALAEYEAWPSQTGPLSVRMALYTGDVESAQGEYRGLTIHRASRILAAAHGGQILLSEAAAGIVRRDLPDGVRLVDLGIYRLRDIAAPERLFQVEFPGMPRTQFAPPNAQTGHSSNLPLRFTRFFGRDEEITRLGAMLQPGSDVRLVTLTGPGGTGKTRLALEVAERLADDFGGAVWFVPLADLSSPTLLPETILSDLKTPLSPQRDALDQIVDTLSRQSSLLVLDNVEHLIDGCAALVRTLLDRVPTLKVLVTSRQTMGITGEQEFGLPPLPTPGSTDTPERLSLFESVQLFVDRAQAVMADFQVNNHNAPAVAELVARLEGIPLAIELAAARAQVLSPAQMLASLGQHGRFDLLVSRKRDVGERQRTLRGAMEWSYRLLSPELQRFFCRLSVFRGGWTAQAAEAIAEEPLALDYLAQLRECSLILSRHDVENAGDVRFGFLETLREFGEGNLSVEERALLRNRHLAFFLALAEEADPHLQGPDMAEWLVRLESEHDNLRAAIEWSSAGRADEDAELLLCGSLSRFWALRGHLTEGRQYCALALARDSASERTSTQAKALFGAGILAWTQGDFVAAGSLFEQTLDIHQKLGNRAQEAANLNALAAVAQYQGDLSTARSMYEQALAINRELRNRGSEATNLTNLGFVACWQGDHPAARLLYEQALAIYREQNNRAHETACLNGLGTVAREQADLEAARSFHEMALTICRELGNRAAEADALNGFGKLAAEVADFSTARTFHERALAVSQQLGDHHQIAESLEALGVAVAGLGSQWRSATMWGSSERIREHIGAPLPPNAQLRYQRQVSSARAAARDDVAFDAAWGEGREMTTDQAIEFALDKPAV